MLAVKLKEYESFVFKLYLKNTYGIYDRYRVSIVELGIYGCNLD